MCWCDPNKRTPCCGSLSCRPPKEGLLSSMERSVLLQAGRIYTRHAVATVLNPARQDAVYFALETCDEAGEVAGKVKKAVRDDNGVFTPERIEAVGKEIGDVIWPLANLADKLGLNFGQLMIDNLEKLNDRARRGVLGGSGDNR
jgi:NTP pyrophosphatase (non-canonical NTP hydrolase)